METLRLLSSTLGLITEVMGRSHREYSLMLMLICWPSLFLHYTAEGIYVCNIIHMLYIFSSCSFLQNDVKCSHSVKLMSWCLQANLERHKRFGQTFYNVSSATLLTQIRSLKKWGPANNAASRHSLLKMLLALVKMNHPLKSAETRGQPQCHLLRTHSVSAQA